ncbi:hypothetical protein K2173_026635 [Erythroxylum novogranatense]|uniref:MBD domain-containing protein n=1 Tax=Erythroxylum novogranatense TaxID=1862640 RepID=A0AAV8TZ99_9ROSI|nr:hypothetical protein K2173_026635 [Erythroxylum novogranatense]
MGDRTAEEWLPEGWTMEVRVRKNGRKDKCYFPPSGGGKFYSKVEVLRYLNDGHAQSEEQRKSAGQQSLENVLVGKDRPKELPPGWIKEVKVTKKGGRTRKDAVQVEKDRPKELPPGWIKEVKVTKKGGRTRKDAFYTDPVSGFVFRSMKDALRYIDTGEIGRLALKPKDGGNRNLVIEDDKTCSTAAAKKLKVMTTERTSLKSNDQSPKSPAIIEDKQRSDSLGVDESTHAVECASGGMRIESCRSTLPRGKDSEENEVNTDASECYKHSMELIKDENKKTGLNKSKKKKVLDLPRRASKRLAGVRLDPKPKMEMTDQGHQAASEQPSHVGANAGEASSESHLSITKVPSPSELVVNIERGNNGDEYRSAILENPGNVGNIADEKTELSLNLQLGELWQDPCIAFAIKTLTGASFDTSESPKMSNDTKAGTLNTMDENAKKEDRGNAVDKKSECTVCPFLDNLPNTEERAREVEACEKGDGKPGSSLSLPIVDVWADPCIEFAIKTLTGAIPLDYSLVGPDFRQSSSCHSQEPSGSSLPNGDDHYQNEFVCQQLCSPGRSVFYGATLVEPALTYGSRGNSGDSSGSTRHHGEQRVNQQL